MINPIWKWPNYVLSLVLAIIILLTAILLTGFDLSWYGREFQHLNVYQSLPSDQVIAQTQNLFA
jgi:hypothetical protein